MHYLDILHHYVFAWPMHENLNITFLAGGLAHCTPAWDRRSDSQDLCFKIYYVTRGEAMLTTSKGVHSLEPESIYIIDGNRLVEMSCREFMDVHWIHFVPESLFVEQVLATLLPIIKIAPTAIRYRRTDWYRIIKANQSAYDSAGKEQILPLDTSCELHSLVLAVLSAAFRLNPPVTHPRRLSELYRFKDVVAFMDTHYHLNPPLEELAATMGMAPEHFHRKFRQLFNITPHNYMFRRRMNKAGNLIKKTNLQIQEIAMLCGYDNQFYFSRIFKSFQGCSPSQYRKREYGI